MKWALAYSVLLVLSGPARAQQFADASGDQLNERERRILTTYVSNQLSDPSSAVFTRITKAKNTGYCGYVNAKNRLGGYSGPKMFYVDIDLANAVIVPAEMELQSMGLAQIKQLERALPVLEANCSP